MMRPMINIHLVAMIFLAFPVFADSGIGASQARLKELGYDPGTLDGAWGAKTRSAVERFQRDSGLPVTGELDSQTTEKLGVPAIPKPPSDKSGGQIAEAEPDLIWRFLGTEKGKGDVVELLYEHPEQYFTMLKMRIYHVPVANTDGKKKSPSDPRLVEIASSLRTNDLVKLSFSADHAIKQIERCSPRPGEDMPDYQEFVRPTTARFDGREFSAVVLRRFLREGEYLIGKLDGNKKWQPDKELASKVNNIPEGTPVEVDVVTEEPGTWRSDIQYFVLRLEEYRPPLTATVAQVREIPPSEDATCFTNKARNTFGIRDEQSISLFVDLKPEGSDKVKSFLAGEYVVLNEVARLKGGEKVLFKTSIVSGKEQLLGLQVGPTQ